MILIKKIKNKMDRIKMIKIIKMVSKWLMISKDKWKMLQIKKVMTNQMMERKNYQEIMIKEKMFLMNVYGVMRMNVLRMPKKMEIKMEKMKVVRSILI